MKSKIKTFWNMTRLEFVRITRNKVILAMLLLMTIAVLLFLSTAQTGLNNIPIAVCRNNTQDQQVIGVLNSTLYSEKVVEVDSIEEGIQLVDNKDVCIFVYVTPGNSVDTIDIYYDSADMTSAKIVEEIQIKKEKFTYDQIKLMLEDYSIKLNEDYFERINLVSITPTEVGKNQIVFGMEVCICVGLVLMFGLSYSMARDNETNVSKMISYMPIGVNKYLLSKIIPYFVLGAIQVLCCLLIGKWVFAINYQINLFLILLMSLAFVLSTISLGLVFSTLKSQIASIFCQTFSLIFPLFAMLTMNINGYPLIIQIFLYCLPSTPFSLFISSAIFNGEIIGKYLIMLLVQTIVYYLVTHFIVYKRSKI